MRCASGNVQAASVGKEGLIARIRDDRSGLFFSFLFTLAVMLMIPSPGHADRLGVVQASVPGMFATRETRHYEMASFSKWMGMLSRHRDGGGEEAIFGEAERHGCAKTAPTCIARDWAQQRLRLAGLPLDDQLGAVNRLVNQARYRLDDRNWGRADYWATPAEFADRAGDCEDYAITKYMLLKALGVPIRRMRIVVLHDTKLGIDHAVLAVDTGRRIAILDNQHDRVMRDLDLTHYEPIYSINEAHWWLHDTAEAYVEIRVERSQTSAR